MYQPMGDIHTLFIGIISFVFENQKCSAMKYTKAVENVTQKNTKFHNRILITEHKIFLFFEVRGPVKDRRNIPKTVNQ